MRTNLFNNARSGLIIFVQAAVLFFIFFVIWSSNSLSVTYVDYSSERLPAAFEDFRIVQISDLHDKKFGREQRRLLDRITRTEPDIVVVTGDLVDIRASELDEVLAFVKDVTEIAPVYYVSGDYEAWSHKYDEIRSGLEALGVSVLDDTRTDIKRGLAKVTLMGLSDPDFHSESYLEPDDSQKLEESLAEMSGGEGFTILLSHRPELLDIYAKYGVDLVFSGHAHGGQIRLPLIGAVAAPDQRAFPKYVSGVHREGDTTMIISRGLGNGVVPVRSFNRPELIVATLHSGS